MYIAATVHTYVCLYLNTRSDSVHVIYSQASLTSLGDPQNYSPRYQKFFLSGYDNAVQYYNKPNRIAKYYSLCYVGIYLIYQAILLYYCVVSIVIIVESLACKSYKSNLTSYMSWNHTRSLSLVVLHTYKLGQYRVRNV